MVKACFFRNKNQEIYRFTVENHADAVVCAAVSALTLTTANAAERFTSAHLVLEYEEDGGFLSCSFPEIKNGMRHHDVNLLLNALFLGLTAMRDEYEDQILLSEQ